MHRGMKMGEKKGKQDSWTGKKHANISKTTEKG
jgi:hypothetical protein